MELVQVIHLGVRLGGESANKVDSFARKKCGLEIVVCTICTSVIHTHDDPTRNLIAKANMSFRHYSS